MAEVGVVFAVLRTKGSNSLTVMAECCSAKSSTSKACCQLLELICLRRVTSHESWSTRSKGSYGVLPMLNRGISEEEAPKEFPALGISLDTLLGVGSLADVMRATKPP